MSDSHTCQALVLTCIDFRFHEQIVQRLKDRGIKAFDLKTDAGAVKNIIADDKSSVREWIYENISIAERLHHIKEVVLINHYDCGAYGGNSVFGSEKQQMDFHKNELDKAEKMLSEKFPQLTIKKFFAKPIGDHIDLLTL